MEFNCGWTTFLMFNLHYEKISISLSHITNMAFVEEWKRKRTIWEWMWIGHNFVVLGNNGIFLVLFLSLSLFHQHQAPCNMRLYKSEKISNEGTVFDGRRLGHNPTINRILSITNWYSLILYQGWMWWHFKEFRCFADIRYNSNWTWQKIEMRPIPWKQISNYTITGISSIYLDNSVELCTKAKKTSSKLIQEKQKKNIVVQWNECERDLMRFVNAQYADQLSFYFFEVAISSNNQK